MESENSMPNHNPQNDIHGDIKTGGGLVNTGNIGTAGGDFVGRDKVIIQQRLDATELLNQRKHIFLSQTVRRFWIDGVLKHSLYNEVLIRLGLDARPEAVNNRPWKLSLQQRLSSVRKVLAFSATGAATGTPVVSAGAGTGAGYPGSSTIFSLCRGNEKKPTSLALAPGGFI